jgi:GH15 family glucan-1,4-alpha-glucosidase
MKRKNGYAPIAAYAAIGDGRTTALVAADGSIDFLSLPDMHCPTAFGALLDARRGGRFVLQPEGRFDAERRYVDRTNVLETTYRARDGVVRVTEALLLQNGGLLPWVEVSRRVEGLSGEVPMRWSVEPRFDWGRQAPAISWRRSVPIACGAGITIGVHSWDAGDPQIGEASVSGSFIARAGSRALLALLCTEEQPIPIPLRADAERRLDETVDVWRRWLGSWDYAGPWEDEVARSALALKLLVFSPMGAIAAAPTTSLPERIGGDKNYDYRYMWVRDASFTLEAFMRLGMPEQVQESFTCLLRSVRSTAPDLHPFYALDGTRATRYVEFDHLDGYRGSRPVRYGNQARRQLQLGSWGDLLETSDLYTQSGNAIDDATGELLGDCLDRLCLAWRDEDSGIWELDDRRHYTASKIAVWMAFDRGAKLADAGELPSRHADRWRDERAAAREFVEGRCWSDDAGAYVEFAGADSLDASVLRSVRCDWPRIAPERFDRTLEAVRRQLDAGEGLLYRTSRHVGDEGAFVACSFWLAEALARRGSVDEGAAVFERVLEHANDVGLLSEEVDPSSGELLGNFPQGLSHLALINAAGAIQDARDAGASAREGAAAR